MKERIEEKLKLIIQVLFLLWCVVLPLSMAGMQIFLGLLLVAWITLAIIRHESPIKIHPFYFFIIAYIASELISVLNSVNWKQSLNAAFSNDWVLIAVPLLISLPITPVWRKRAFKALMISACVVGLIGIIQFFTGINFIKGGMLTPQGNFFRAIGTYSGFYTYGGNQLFAFAIAYAFLILSKKWTLEKNQYLLFTMLIFLSILASFTRSAWLGGILVLLLGSFIVNRKRFIYVFGILILTGFILFMFIPDLQSRFLSIFSESQNEGRLTLWKTSWKIFKDYPIFGIGQGNFPKYFFIYKVPGFYDATSHAHNDFINTTVVNGIIGLITWLGMWAAWFYYIVKAFVKNVFEEADRRIILGAILSVAGILVAAQFQCFYTDLENNIYWWFLVTTSLQIVIRSKKNKEKGSLQSSIGS